MKIYMSASPRWLKYFMPRVNQFSHQGPIDESAGPLLGNCFLSFWEYWRGSGKAPKQLGVQPGDSVIVDSGAHSFFSMAGLGVHASSRDQQPVDPRDYNRAYIEFLKSDNYNYFVELDIGELVGMDFVVEVRDAYKKHGLWEKCIPAWHPYNGFDDYEWMLDNMESNYVALEKQRPNRPPIPYVKMLKMAYDKGIRVHIFAALAPEWLKVYPFYSTDAVTWLNGVIFSSKIDFVGDRLKSRPAKRNTKSPFSKLSDTEKLAHNIRETHKYQEYLGRYWLEKGIDWETQIAEAS